MVVKPIAFVALATLAVVGAGTGAYLAVRDNRGPVTAATESLPPDPLSETTRTQPGVAHPVEATEELISANVPSGSEATDRQVSNQTTEIASAAATARNAPRRSESSAHGSPPARNETTPSTEIATRSPQSGSARSTEGAVAAVEHPAESPLLIETPNLVALGMVEPTAFGRLVDAEERPRIVRNLVIAADSVVGLQVDTPVSTEDAEIEDNVEARVTRDVIVNDQIAVPAGTRVIGSVVLVESAGEIRGAARLGVRFHTVVLDDVFELPIITETVYREGKGRGSESAAKIGGAAVGGAILGAIFGGRQGAAIGSAAGAAGGTAAAMAGDAQPATLPAGSTLTVRLSRPATVTIEY